MKPLILVSLIFLSGCAGKIEYRTIPLDIPGETLTPCPISDRVPRTVNELSSLAIEHLQSAECANGKIETIAEVIEGQSQ